MHTVIGLFPTNIYLFKNNNRNTRKRCKICSKLTIKTPLRHSGVFTANFKHIPDLLLKLLLLTLSMYLFPYPVSQYTDQIYTWIRTLYFAVMHSWPWSDFYASFYNLGYSLLKNARCPNLWLPYEDSRSNSIILSFMGKCTSQNLVSFSSMTYIFWTAYDNCLKFGMKIGTINIKWKFEQTKF